MVSVSTVRNHGERASARRQALVEATRQLAAESGLGVLSHRAISRRAGLPPTTTTYFFSSIDELVNEALRSLVDETVSELQDLTIAWAKQDTDIEALAAAVAAALNAAPVARDQAQVEIYLAASRRPELRPAVARVLAAFEDLALVAMRTAGIAHPEQRTRAVVALADGFMLHHLAHPQPDDENQLRLALLALLRA